MRVCGGTIEESIAHIAESYFQHLFTSANLVNANVVLDSANKLVTPKMNDILLQRYKSEEVRLALFQMHPSKSPRPAHFFFQKFWHIVGTDVTIAILSVLNFGHMLKKMNYTHIVLIPKKNDPKHMAEYRPISLGKVVFHILSRVIANCLKIILPNIISDAQSAFVPDRLITDNTTIAYELLHRMCNKRKGKLGLMAIKLDISKAYDWVEWPFLKKVMEKLGFDPRWLRLAMKTVTTSSYSVLINGEPKGFIDPSWGIRQGNSLSPYLFLLYVEGLSAFLRIAEESRVIKGIKSSQHGVSVSYLLFVDDSLLFCLAIVGEC